MPDDKESLKRERKSLFSKLKKKIKVSKISRWGWCLWWKFSLSPNTNLMVFFWVKKILKELCYFCSFFLARSLFFTLFCSFYFVVGFLVSILISTWMPKQNNKIIAIANIHKVFLSSPSSASSSSSSSSSSSPSSSSSESWNWILKIIKKF